MKATTVTKFKFFFAHQDREQEQWLRAMALQGLHLTALNAGCFWTFRQGEPADVVYRVDFDHDQNLNDYRVLFEDAGWELAAQVTGWQYWRKQKVDSREPEIHTDPQSKIAKFKRLMASLFLIMLPMPIFTLTKPESLWRLSPPFLVAMFAMLALCAYMLGALLLRIRAVRRGS